VSRYSVVFVVAVSSFSALQAQDSQITGRILDQSQAAVSSAQATLTRVDTGDHRQTLSTSEGYYTFPLLLPGVYDLIVQKDGFQSQTRKGIKVETGQAATLDVTLTVGEISQTVNVEADVPVLKTDSAAVSHVVTNQTIVDMPLIDRRSAQLTRLNGFIVQTNSGSSATFSIAGGRGDNTNYYVDGGTVQNVAMGTPDIYFDPPVEAMQEFNVAMSNYEAELGRSGGAVLQMTTKSGTNQFHGSAYEYFRNDDLNANTFFATSKPVLRYNLFGSSFGGPIKKDKTWFFFNYEGRRQVLATTQTLVIPTQAEVNGNFSGISTAIKDPLTGQPFPGNIIPASRLDPVGAKLAQFYPAPNVTGALAGSVNFIANDPAATVINNYVARIDHVFDANNRIFGRFLGQPDTTTTASIFPVAGTDSFGYLVHDYYYNGSGTWDHNFSPNLFNEFRLTFSRRQTLSISPGANTALSQQIGLKGANPDFFPAVTVSGFTGLGYGSGNGQERLQTPVEADQVADNVTKISGNHQIKFGVEYRYGKDGDLYDYAAGGSLTFNNQVTGNSVASMLLGWVNQGSVLATERLHSRVDSYAGYVQDDWRLTPRLTLNLGLRYDVDSPRWDVDNRQNSFNPTEINPVSGTPGVVTFSGVGGQSKYAHNWDLRDFGPRLGFAWRVTDNWVIRGGGGILYAGEYDFAAPVILYTGFDTQGTFVSGNNGSTPAFLLANGFPALTYPSTANLTTGYGAVPVGQTPTTSVTFFEPNRKTGYLYQASLDIQRQIGRNLVIDIGYLGTFGHDLSAVTPISINQVPTNLLGPGNLQALRPFPQFSNVQVLGDSIGRSNYNGVNFGVEKRLSAGLQFKADYTYSKFLDNIGSRADLGNPQGITAGAGAFTNYYNQGNDWGLSGNDIRHRFIVSTIYDLPVGRGKLLHPQSRVLNSVIGGWSAGVIGEFHTGTPLSPFELTNSTNSYSDGVRPNVVGDPNLPGDRSRAQQLAEWFNVNAFAVPAPYTFGDAGRTFGAGPSFFSMDGSLLKDFSVERFAVQFRAEVLNLTNHANFANPDTRQGSPTFGEITQLVTGNQARIIQLGLHLKF
jgi:Carboxypeptidase regulatory-like domain/TonB dependent receptor